MDNFRGYTDISYPSYMIYTGVSMNTNLPMWARGKTTWCWGTLLWEYLYTLPKTFSNFISQLPLKHFIYFMSLLFWQSQRNLHSWDPPVSRSQCLMRLSMSSTCEQPSLHFADPFPSAKKGNLTVQILFMWIKAGWDLTWHCEALGLFLGIVCVCVCINYVSSLLKGLPWIKFIWRRGKPWWLWVSFESPLCSSKTRHRYFYSILLKRLYLHGETPVRFWAMKLEDGWQ